MLPQGDHLFKRLSLDETLSRVWDVYMKGFWTFLKICLVVSLLNAFIWSWLMLPVLRWVLGVTESTLLSNEFNDQNNDKYTLDAALLTFLHGILEALLASVASGGIILAVAFIYADEQEDGVNGRLNWWVCLRDGGLKNAVTLITASAITTIGEVVGILFFWVPGIYLLVIWFLTNPAIVLESNRNNNSNGNNAVDGEHPSPSIRAILKSQNLTRGSWCYCFCTALIGYAVVVLMKILWIMIVLEGIFKDTDQYLLYTLTGSLLMTVPLALVLPIFAILQTIMYFNLRVEKEGMNFEALLKDLGQTTEHGSYRQVSLLETAHAVLGDDLELHTESIPQNNSNRLSQVETVQGEVML
eukprot:CAMPEP_0194149536 /NCGR_PEP_ID=MMETSP0152-20130528/38471_1 /TAXON_ID=1049557 /ORGANISM="Thalassiothrix antarctica, Strain L6-D1" /LENGTH=355 /DNA_ID=CAMNT_0038851767 /DNA_START=56 /DNA_END=1123 /DNA_ORIENTATION=-